MFPNVFLRKQKQIKEEVVCRKMKVAQFESLPGENS